MKLSLSTDFGSPAHWARVVDFARRHGVERLVFWGDYTDSHFAPPFLYPKHPGLMPDERRRAVQQIRDRFRGAADMAGQAGMEFWYVFQVFQIPRGCDEAARRALPGLFNQHNEPDMSGELAYQFIRDQLDELFAIVPELAGIEMWIMECANIKIARLQHQSLKTTEICGRIVDAVYEHVSSRGKRLVQELHTAGGDPVTRKGLFDAASRHPDIILSADNTVGDFQLHTPFNRFIVEASETNPVQVHFDLNGEYWGRNFVPTAALDLYVEHIETARALGVVHLDGRLSTGHDTWSPHASILPSRRKFYPVLTELSDSKPLPKGIEVCCTDTLCGMNAEFFCQRAKDPSVKADDVVREFLVGEFGDAAAALTPVFMGLQRTLGKIFFVDKNYYGAQSVLPAETLIHWSGYDVLLTLLPGTPVPPPELVPECDGHNRAVLAGWAVPLGHVSAGAEAMIAEKEQAVSEAEGMLREVAAVAGALRAEDREFLVRQFEDLVFFARAFRWLLEAHVHYYFLKDGKRRGALPDEVRFNLCLEEVARVASEWEARYPGGRYLLGEQLRSWTAKLSHRDGKTD